MRIDCSEPEECGCVFVTCYHCRTSGMLNTQESEPSNVIASSVTSMPASSRPVQALGHDSAAIGSTSTSSPVHCSSPIGSGTLTPLAPPDITSVSSEPAQSVGPNNLGSGASAAPTSSTVSPGHSSSPSRFVFAPSATSVSSSPIQAAGPTSFGFCSGASASKPSIFGSRQAPDCYSSGLFGAPKPSIFGSRHDCDSCGIFGAPKPSFFGSRHNCESCGIFGPRHDCDSCGIFGAPKPSIFGSRHDCDSSGIFGAPKPSIFGSRHDCDSSGIFGAPKSSIFGSRQAPDCYSSAFAAPTPSTFVRPIQAHAFGSGASVAPAPSTASPGHISSPTRFVFAPSATSVSSAPTQSLRPTTFGSMQAPVFDSGASAVTSVSSAFAFPSPPLFGSMQAPVQASAPNTSTSFSFGDFGKTASTSPSLFRNGVDFARPDVGFSPTINPPTTTAPGATPWNVSSLFGPTQDFGKASCASSTTPKNTFSSLFPRFGVDYLPGSQPFGPNPPTPTFRTEQGSRYPRYAPTPDDCDFRAHRNMMISIAASNAYQHKSHDELRWEDYKQGDKGGVGFFPAAHISPGSRPNAFFSPSTALPSIFAPRSIPDHPQRTTTGTTQGNMTSSSFGFVPAAGGTTSSSSSSSSSSTIPVAAPISSSVERPHETAAVSSPASGCTACGATSSSSASGCLGFNVATTPPSAATSLPGLFFSTAGSPMMFGTTNPAAQGTTPTVQAYPVHGLILLPFAAMNLQ